MHGLLGELHHGLIRVVSVHVKLVEKISAIVISIILIQPVIRLLQETILSILLDIKDIPELTNSLLIYLLILLDCLVDLLDLGGLSGFGSFPLLLFELTHLGIHSYQGDEHVVMRTLSAELPQILKSTGVDQIDHRGLVSRTPGELLTESGDIKDVAHYTVYILFIDRLHVVAIRNSGHPRQNETNDRFLLPRHFTLYRYHVFSLLP